MPYANREELIADYIPEAKSASEIAAIERLLTAVSAFVDTYCRRPSGYFNPAEDEPIIKRIRGEGLAFLRLPVHVFGSVEEVKTSSGTLISDSAYYESEKNGWLYAEEKSLYPESSFDNCTENVWHSGAIYKVKARWGYEATPADLSEAVRITVARIWETQKGTLGQITPNGFVIERALPPFAKEVLGNYKKRQFEI